MSSICHLPKNAPKILAFSPKSIWSTGLRAKSKTTTRIWRFEFAPIPRWIESFGSCQVANFWNQDNKVTENAFWKVGQLMPLVLNSSFFPWKVKFRPGSIWFWPKIGLVTQKNPFMFCLEKILSVRLFNRIIVKISVIVYIHWYWCLFVQLCFTEKKKQLYIQIKKSTSVGWIKQNTDEM